MRGVKSIVIWVLLWGALFVLAVRARDNSRVVIFEPASAVVMPAPLQVFLYAGDRYLAANIESVRAVMSGGGRRDDEAGFRLRAHNEVSRLNPCHEDNYWIGNAEMTWGGAHEQGFEMLGRVMNCRTWDEWPAFFYGFNLYFFQRNASEASRWFEVAAQRTSDEKNAAAFKGLSVIMRAGHFDDLGTALKLIERERDQAKNPLLRDRLAKRAVRLRGLLVLREAQAAYEKRFQQPLKDPGQLTAQGILSSVPVDPLGIGYVFENGRFQLQTARNEGLDALRPRP